VLLEANLTKLADDQFLTAMAWGIASLQDTDDPRARAKEQGCSPPRPTQDKKWPRLVLVSALELLSAADWSILIFLPEFRTGTLESMH
jgi:hypothetical protein